MSFPTREYSFIFSVDKEFSQPPVLVMAGDSYSTIFNFLLLDKYEPIDLTGCSVKLSVRKPDATLVYQTAQIVQATEGTVKVTLTPQTLAVSGIAEAEVSIYGVSGERITFFGFTFEISSTIDPTVESGNDLPAITALINDSHTHINKETLDKVPDTTGIEADKVLTVGDGGTLTWAFVAGSSADVTALTTRVSALEVDKSDIGHNHDGVYSPIGHDHDAVYAPSIHTHAISDVSNLQFALDGKASATHNHDTLYAEKTVTEAHVASTANPHNVTKAQVGLNNVDNTADLDKPISTATQTALNGKSNTGHTHTGVYEPVITRNSGFNLSLGTTAGTVAEGNHLHTGTYEPAFTKNTGFNKNFGTSAGTVSEGNHTHADLHTHANKYTLDNVTASGDGTQFLANDGTYKTVSSQASMEIYDDGVLKGTATKVNFATNLDVSVVNGEATINATGTGGGGGDMYKATYDANLNGIADKAESIDDGLGHTASATNIQLAVTNMHTHSNSATLNKITYTGVGSSIDLKGIEDNTTALAGKADINHNHSGVYEPVISTKNTAFNLNLGTTAGTVSEGNHNHDTLYMATGSAYTKTESDAKYLVNTDIVSLPKGAKIGSKRYYNNTGSANTVYVKIATVTVASDYNRAFFKADIQITGSANVTGTLECFVYHLGTYNTVSSNTYMNIFTTSGKRTLSAGDIVVVKTDTGTSYTYEFYAKVIGYATLNVNVPMYATESATLDLLPTSVVTSSSLPTGATNIDVVYISGGKMTQQYSKNATQGATTLTVSISSFSTATDVLMVYVNGSLWYEDVHWSVSGTTITILNSIGLDVDDEILIVCNKNAKI